MTMRANIETVSPSVLYENATLLEPANGDFDANFSVVKSADWIKIRSDDRNYLIQVQHIVGIEPIF